MRTLSYFFFYTYIGLILVAGFWGAFIGARVDQHMLLNLNIKALTETTRANVLTQYRFLRAIELGFGLFSITFRKEIFTVKKFNTLFLTIMLSGVVARVISLLADGSPNWIFYFFLIYEATGVVIIYLYSRQQINKVDEAVLLESNS